MDYSHFPDSPRRSVPAPLPPSELLPADRTESLVRPPDTHTPVAAPVGSALLRQAVQSPTAELMRRPDASPAITTPTAPRTETSPLVRPITVPGPTPVSGRAEEKSLLRPAVATPPAPKPGALPMPTHQEPSESTPATKDGFRKAMAVDEPSVARKAETSPPAAGVLFDAQAARPDADVPAPAGDGPSKPPVDDGNRPVPSDGGDNENNPEGSDSPGDYDRPQDRESVQKGMDVPERSAPDVARVAEAAQADADFEGRRPPAPTAAEVEYAEAQLRAIDGAAYKEGVAHKSVAQLHEVFQTNEDGSLPEGRPMDIARVAEAQLGGLGNTLLAVKLGLQTTYLVADQISAAAARPVETTVENAYGEIWEDNLRVFTQMEHTEVQEVTGQLYHRHDVSATETHLVSADGLTRIIIGSKDGGVYRTVQARPSLVTPAMAEAITALDNALLDHYEVLTQVGREAGVSIQDMQTLAGSNVMDYLPALRNITQAMQRGRLHITPETRERLAASAGAVQAQLLGTADQQHTIDSVLMGLRQYYQALRQDTRLPQE